MNHFEEEHGKQTGRKKGLLLFEQEESILAHHKKEFLGTIRAREIGDVLAHYKKERGYP
jgi:hypothetical protein